MPPPAPPGAEDHHAGTFATFAMVLAGALLIVGVTVTAYYPLLRTEPREERAGTLWDDDYWLKNPNVQSPKGLPALWSPTTPGTVDYLPVTATAFWLQYQRWGDNAVAFHAVNVGLHALAALLLWAVMVVVVVTTGPRAEGQGPRVEGIGPRAKGQGPSRGERRDGVENSCLPGPRSLALGPSPLALGPLLAPFLAALFFALHPVNVASAGWISELKNTLSMVFYLVAMLCCLRAEASDEGDRLWTPGVQWAWFALGVIAFVAGLMSKASIVMLPVVLLLVWWWRDGRVTFRRVQITLPLFIASLVMGLVTLHFQQTGAINTTRVPVLDPASQVVRATSAVWFYLGKFFAPVNLSMIYRQWAIDPGALRWWLPMAALVALVAALWWLRGQSWARAALLALAYVLVSLLPVLGFVNMFYLMYAPAADHWAYVASAGLAGFAGAGLVWLAGRVTPRTPLIGHLIALALGLAIAGWLAVATYQRAQTFINEEVFWRATIAQNPDASPAHNSLGVILSERGDRDAGRYHYLEAIRSCPPFSKPYYNLGNLHLHQEQYDQAERRYLQALEREPGYQLAHLNLGVARYRMGRSDEALASFQEAHRLNPNDPGANFNLSIVLMNTGRWRQAKPYVTRVLELVPGDRDAQAFMGQILAAERKESAAPPPARAQPIPGTRAP